MPVVQLPLLAPPHHNQQLFSDYYLNTILPARADWRQLATSALPVMREIARIFAAYKPSSNEAQTEDGMIKPVLAALGHSYEVQAALKTPDGTKKPDYIFYRDLAALNANRGKTLDDRLPTQGAFAVGDAKYWERPLDSALKNKSGDPFSNKNPAFQIQLGGLAARRLELRDDIGAIDEAQWKWLLKQRLKQKLGSMADLVKIYRARQPAIAALDARIAATDQLIDQIVYALYDLTDAEIALVEGTESQ